MTPEETVAEEKPLPCPFCGGEPEVVHDGEATYISCENQKCPIHPCGGIEASEVGAIRLWNARKSMTPAEGLREAGLRGAIEKVLADEESGKGWGPDVTTCAHLRAGLLSPSDAEKQAKALLGLLESARIADGIQYGEDDQRYALASVNLKLQACKWAGL